MLDPYSLPIAQVRASFARCCKQADFLDIFYHRLVAETPALGSRFAATDMATQDTLVRAGINHLIDFAAGIVGVDSKIRELGVKHDRVHLNVDPALYERWVGALLHAVAECDERCDSELAAGWAAVLQPGIGLMSSLY